MIKKQEGFTLLELVMAVGIIGAVVLTIGMTITTLLINADKPTTQQILLQQVKSAGFRIPRDINMANDVTLNGPNGFPFTVNIPVDQDENHDYTVDYLYDGNTLKRQEFDSSHSLITDTPIIQYVDTDNTTFEDVGEGLYKLTIRVSMRDEVVTTSYEMKTRLTLD